MHYHIDDLIKEYYEANKDKLPKYSFVKLIITRYYGFVGRYLHFPVRRKFWKFGAFEFTPKGKAISDKKHKIKLLKDHDKRRKWLLGYIDDYFPD